MNKGFVIAYDLGTSGVKAAVVDMNGDVLGTAAATYPLYVPEEGWAEQDPEQYWSGVCSATKAVLATCGVSPQNAAGMVFGTQWKGIIPISKDGRVLHNSIIWLDARAQDQARRLNERFGADCYASCDYWPKLQWLRENKPEIIEQAHMILEANSYLKWKATGEFVVDISNCFVSSFDANIEKQYADVLEFIDIPREKFPKWARCDELAGRVTPAAAEELGVVAGIPVFAGCSDIPGITIGSGCYEPGSVHAYFGSSAWIGYCIPHGDGAAYVSPFDFECDISTPLGLQAAGLSLNWVIAKLYAAEQKQLGDGVYDLINKDVAEIPAGSEGVLATPWFYGEIPPLFGPDARGNFLNLGPNHDRRHMARAVMEGICYMMKMTERYCVEELHLYDFEAINAVGGGSCSDEWMQMFANILNRTVCVPYQPRHAGAVGIASCALVGLGVYDDFFSASKKIGIERKFVPQPDAVSVYERGYDVFKRLYGMLKPMFSALNDQI